MGIIAAMISCQTKEQTTITDTNDAVVVDDTLETDTLATGTEGMNNLNLTINAASDSNLSGTVNFTQNGNEVTMNVNIAGITPGEHAIHIHENGDCSAADASSAGGHWNPTEHAHGKFGSDAYHMGDIGNLTADADGNATLEFSTDKWCLGCDDETKNLIGKSLIIHEGVDDFTTQPTGDAGGRIGCVVIQ